MNLTGIIRRKPAHPAAFTLIEVVVALALLSVSLAGLFQFSTHSQLRLAKAMDKWDRTHKMVQAAEYLLLQKSEDDFSIPDEFFDYRDFYVHADLEDLDENALPDDLNNLDNQLPLRALRIELVRSADQEVVDTWYVDKICFESNEEEASTNSK